MTVPGLTSERASPIYTLGVTKINEINLEELWPASQKGKDPPAAVRYHPAKPTRKALAKPPTSPGPARSAVACTDWCNSWNWNSSWNWNKEKKIGTPQRSSPLKRDI